MFSQFFATICVVDTLSSAPTHPEMHFELYAFETFAHGTDAAKVAFFPVIAAVPDCSTSIFGEIWREAKALILAVLALAIGSITLAISWALSARMLGSHEVRRILVSVFASLWCLCAAHGAALPVEASRTLDEVTVAGVVPGPGLWQVRHGANVLWLVGTLNPVPNRMQWRSAELDARLAEADAVLDEPGLAVGTGRGMLHALTLLPSLLGARKLPDGKKLADVLTPELYARWSELKAQHLGRDRAIERWRPMFAAGKLHAKAVGRAGLSFKSPVFDHVSKARKRRDLPLIDAKFALTLNQPRQALREFKRGELDDIDCFERTLQRLESDVALLSARAEAWAIGDVEALRALYDTDPDSACLNALTSASMFQKNGLDDARAKMRATWFAAAEQALTAHRTTVGTVPISLLLDAGPDGVLASFAARGYRVLGPDDVEDGSVDDGVGDDNAQVRCTDRIDATY